MIHRWLCIVVALLCCLVAVATSASAEYVVDKRRVVDLPTGMSVQMWIVVPLEMSKPELESLLTSLSREQFRTKGDKYHSSPTEVEIYVYTNKENAKEGAWGMIAISQETRGAKAPTIKIQEGLWARLKQPPEEKFGLPEQIRRRIWNEIGAAQDRADREAMMRYPDQLVKRVDMRESLTEKYTKEVLAKHKLTREQGKSIDSEGISKHWPQGPLPKENRWPIK